MEGSRSEDINSSEANSLKTYASCCSRIQKLINLINKNEIDKDEILEHLIKTAEMMEVLASDPQFFIDDDIIGDADNDILPNEIKEWIAATFTNTTVHVKTSERPTFRAVANAILATIMVEKIFKKSNENAAVKIPPQISKIFDNTFNSWDYNVFVAHAEAHDNILRYTVFYVFLNQEILKKFKISFELLEAFLNEIQQGYAQQSNPLYNSLHCADVVQTLHYIVYHYQINQWMTDLQVFAMLFSAIIHDYDVPGHSNTFLVNTKHKLALIYNDVQVRQNGALHSTFKVLQDPSKNCLRGLSKDELKEFRRLVIECVFSMDPCQHGHLMRQTKAEITLNVEMDKLKIMSFLLHVCDFSQPSKELTIYTKWLEMWEEQQFQQGDAEYQLNIPYSPLCNRKTHLRSDTQTYYIIHIIDPMFHVLGSLIDSISAHSSIKHSSFVENMFVPKLSTSTSVMATYPWENKIYYNKSVWTKKSASRLDFPSE